MGHKKKMRADAWLTWVDEPLPRPLPGEFLYKGPSDIVMVRRQDGYDLDGARGFLRTDRAAMRAEYAGTPWPPDVDVVRRVLSRSK